ncbi:hypothetical protein BJ878DRAFT_533067 [Calycina marina]|uniref:Uncharacterized protein n=1 Tax=Calycina marina TaxID=1763456 RepID=A0A9P7Z6T1_9HELO|nr:hypothetical protein BJ878DRAFT_533067 [Calycina marina]
MSTHKKSLEVSHGRGGAGNIGVDPTEYGDGEIVRQGVPGDHGDGAFSVGRGGAANIGSPGLPATQRKDEVVVPEQALRPSTEDQTYHSGRGGEGNIHHPGDTGVKKQEGLADKLKNKLFKKKVAKQDAAASEDTTTTTI